jgi:deoxyribodipyrimidine photo-lyase
MRLKELRLSQSRGRESGRPASRGTIVWYRQDLRLHDQPALAAAADRDGWVMPVYILSENEEGDWPPGAASRWWLHHSLLKLSHSLQRRSSRLVLLKGTASSLLPRLAHETGADAVYWNRRYEPAAVTRDALLKDCLRDSGLAAHSFNGALLSEPWDVRSPADKPYRVFAPYKRRLLQSLQLPAAFARPRKLTAPKAWPESRELGELQLMPDRRWYERMQQHWTPGEAGAMRRARRFLANGVKGYGDTRNRPAGDGTSALSPHLHFGELSVRQLWRWGERAVPGWPDCVFASELAWREFAHHLLFYNPRTPVESLDRQFEHFPWQRNTQSQQAWQRGLTGFPIVDAGMRQLWALGWMHNRVRMIVASLLVKNLRQPWLDGARWFWDTLVDADLANNTLNWQWTAGCGADAAPYFRIFNPVTQGEKFDPDGDYVREWLPELAKLPARYIHEPHLAPAEVLAAANVRIGESYPAPVVDLKDSRREALAAYLAMRR